MSLSLDKEPQKSLNALPLPEESLHKKGHNKSIKTPNKNWARPTDASSIMPQSCTKNSRKELAWLGRVNQHDRATRQSLDFLPLLPLSTTVAFSSTHSHVIYPHFI